MTSYRNKIDPRITEPGDQIVTWETYRAKVDNGGAAEFPVTAVTAPAPVDGLPVLEFLTRAAGGGWEIRTSSATRQAPTAPQEVVRYADVPLTWNGVSLAALTEGQEVSVFWSSKWRPATVVRVERTKVVAEFPVNSTGDLTVRAVDRDRIHTTPPAGSGDPVTVYGYPEPEGQSAIPYVRTSTPPSAPPPVECLPGCKPAGEGKRVGSHENGCPVFGAILAAGDEGIPAVDYTSGRGRLAAAEPTPVAARTVRLLDRRTYDLARLTEAITVLHATGSEGAARYNLVHGYGWPATDAVDYTNGAAFCLGSGLDPSHPSSWMPEERAAEPLAEDVDMAGAAADAEERDAIHAELAAEAAAEAADDHDHEHCITEEGVAPGCPSYGEAPPFRIPDQRDQLGATGAEVLEEIRAGDEAPEIPGQRAAGAAEEFPELAPGRDVRAVGWALHSPGLVGLGRDAIADKRSHLVRRDILDGARLADDVRPRDLVVARRHPGLWRYMADGADGMVMIIRAWAPGEKPEGDAVWLHRGELVPAPVVRISWGQLQGGEFLAEARGELDRVTDPAYVPGRPGRVCLTVARAVAAGQAVRTHRDETAEGVARVYLDADEWWASLVAEDNERPALIARRGRWVLVWPEAGDLPEFLECETDEAARVDYANWHADPRITPRVGDTVTAWGAGPRGDGLHLEIRTVVDEIGTEDLAPGETAWDVTGPRLGLGYLEETKVRLHRGMFAWTHRA